MVYYSPIWTFSAYEMPTSDNPSDANAERIAVDASFAVAYLDASHTAHADCVAALDQTRAALAGHAAFETFSVLTRHPGRAGIPPIDVIEALTAAFPHSCRLDAKQQGALLHKLATSGVNGGMTYDALVGEAARVNNRILFTRDRRAIATYTFLGVRYELFG